MKKKEVISSAKQKNKTVSEELLVSVRDSLYKLKDYLNGIDFTEDDDADSKKAMSIINIIEKMGKAFETLVILEKKVQSETLESAKVRGNAKLSLLEEGEI